MFKISEFAKLTRVSARMLRYYDKNNLFHPVHIDPITGYRMYSANQISSLNRIVMLRDVGFSVDEIKELLDHFHNMEFLQTACQRKVKSLALPFNCHTNI